MGEPIDTRSINNDYSLEDGSTNYEKFLEDLLPNENNSKEPGRISDILRNSLTSVSIVTEGHEPVVETISPSNTTVKTINLMQQRLHQYSPDTEPAKIENPDHERALTIATFRLLNRLPSVMGKYSLGVSWDDTIQDLKMKVDGLIATTEKEKYWRSPIYDSTGVIISESNEAFDRKNGYPTNPDGKVSVEEMNNIVLPRVIKIVSSI